MGTAVTQLPACQQCMAHAPMNMSAGADIVGIVELQLLPLLGWWKYRTENDDMNNITAHSW